MDVVLPFAALIGASGLFLAASRKKQQGTTQQDKKQQGFENMSPTVQNILPKEHLKFVNNAAKRYNPLANLIDPLNNPLLPPDYTESEFNTINKNVRDALQNINGTPNDPSFDMDSINNINNLNNGNGSDTYKIINKCQSIRTLDCNAFNDPKFAENCGICFKDGKDNRNDSILGGLYITDIEKSNAERYAKSMNSKVNYTPTVGKCAPNYFTITKESCKNLQDQIKCEISKTFDEAGCVQSTKDDSFVYIDPKTPKRDFSVGFKGVGNLKITSIRTNGPQYEPQTYKLSDEKDNGIVNQTYGSYIEGDELIFDMFLLLL